MATTPPSDVRDYFGNLLKPPVRAEVTEPSSDFEQLLHMHNVSIYKDTKTGKNIMFVHAMRPHYLNGSLYADMAVESAENFCRNPERNIGGNYCFYTHQFVIKTISPTWPTELIFFCFWLNRRMVPAIGISETVRNPTKLEKTLRNLRPNNLKNLQPIR